ncbi:flagellar protein FlgN [Hyphomicrobium sp.]|uniref:flagellar protein FlgN n=1 Tax=Hyphomicrobium sp. TaxID=82 RepID=UPI002FE19C19
MYQQSSVLPMTARPEAAVPFVATPGARSGATAMIAVTIQRLEEIVDQETMALRSGKTVNLKEFNDRKSQALLELTRASRQMQGGSPDPALAKLVGALKVKLAVNQAALKMHLEAVREISTSLSDAIRQAESDGTYTQAISSSARRL